MRVQIPPYSDRYLKGQSTAKLVKTMTLKTGPNAGREGYVVQFSDGAHRTYPAADCRGL